MLIQLCTNKIKENTFHSFHNFFLYSFMEHSVWVHITCLTSYLEVWDSPQNWNFQILERKTLYFMLYICCIEASQNCKHKKYTISDSGRNEIQNRPLSCTIGLPECKTYVPEFSYKTQMEHPLYIKNLLPFLNIRIFWKRPHMISVLKMRRNMYNIPNTTE